MVAGRVDEKAWRWIGRPEILRDEAWLLYEENIYQNMEEISDNEIQTSSWNISVASASFLYIPRTILQGK
jgi:hypothetical protein